jgi:hypothetical protein
MKKQLLRLGCVLGLMSGCAALTNAARSPGATESPKTQTLPTCPTDIVEAKALELGFRPEMKSRAWVKALTTADLGFQPHEQVARAFQQQLSLTSGTLEVLGLRETRTDSEEGGGSVVFARQHADGYCVVNSWSTWQQSVVDLSLAGTWTSPDGRLSILLLKLVLPKQPGGPETRWVTLGTDGHRAWIALGTPPQHQLIVPSVKLIPKGKDLYVDIQQRYVTRLRLGADGHFLLPAPMK